MNLDPIRNHLKRLNAEIGRARFCEVIFTFLRHLVEGVFVVALLDFAIHVNSYALRLIFLAAAIAWAVSKVVEKRKHPVYKKLDEPDLARVFERRYPELEGAWVASLEFEDRKSEPVVEHFLKQATAKADEIKKESMVQLGPLKKIRSVSLSTLIVLTLIFVFVPQGQIAAQRLILKDVYWPTKNELDMSSIKSPQLKGEDFRLSVRAVKGKELPIRAELTIITKGGEVFPYEMSRTSGGELFAEIEGLPEDSEVVIEGGDFTSRPVAIQVVERPRVNVLTVTSTYPSYIKEEPVVFPVEDRIFSTIQGSMIQLVCDTNKNIVEASLEVDGIENVYPMKIAGRQISCEVPLAENGLWRIRMKGSDGFDMKPIMGLQFEALKDQVPQVNVVSPKRDLEMSVQGEFMIKGHASDDFGLKNIEIHTERVTLEGQVISEVISLRDKLAERKTPWEYYVNLEKLQAKEGEIFKYQVHAIDHKGQKGISKQVAVNVVNKKALLDRIDIEMIKIKNLLETMKNREELVLEFSQGVKAGLESTGEISVEDMSMALEKQASQSKTSVQIIEIGNAIMNMVDGNKISMPKMVTSLKKVADMLQKFTDKLSPDAVKALEEVRSTKKNIDKALKAEQICLEAIEKMIAQLELTRGIVDVIERLQSIIDDEKGVQKSTQEGK